MNANLFSKESVLIYTFVIVYKNFSHSFSLTFGIADVLIFANLWV